MPNTSSSILKSSGSANPHDIKCEVITAEQNDYDFIYRMKKLIYSLSDTYKNTFISIFIDGKSIRSFHRNDIYTILKRGYLKLALLDATIDYSAEDEMKYQNYKLSHYLTGKIGDDTYYLYIPELNLYTCNNPFSLINCHEVIRL